ncbi:MAG: type II toxin-antitoxin system HipA family toxin [Marinagarivorans sp.]|nr:type II toxin-antitoxin system HipA family toxin [Marinagarivorans sp.]
MSSHPRYPLADKIMSTPWVKNQKLHPVLSNLLPEGALRNLIAQQLKTHIDHEFNILTSLGDDLPGALVATVMAPEDIPDYLLSPQAKAKIIPVPANINHNKFSLAGVQIKFSMKLLHKGADERYNLTPKGELGDWIIKTPSTQHQFVPLNEYTAMSLAAMAGVNIPEIKLVDLNNLDNLPPLNLPNEQYAFAIKRFDRNNNTRLHMEDFAQVLVKYPHEKYNSANYAQIGKIIYDYSGDALADAQQLARRLLVNILLANGDAHLKNWSLFYPDKITPRLSPAYDIVTTNVYMENETEFALNLGKNKNWYRATFADFELWAIKAGIPWRVIKPHLHDVIEKARTLWPSALKDLPMADGHKKVLLEHWGRLMGDFRV